MVRDLIDPILARREQQRRQLLDISSDANLTFREAAEAFIRAQEPHWRNGKHVQQWRNTLITYACPVIGDVRVRGIDTAMIVRILQPCMGFRSTFRDWVAECTEYPDSLAEEALAHVIVSQTVAAYRRRDQLEHRRLMTEDWGRYCGNEQEKTASTASAVPQAFAA
ncbi:hypothetical protein LMG27177_07321 [Paraburkholderia fynbosensis]|uniref:Phage integrase central domain-containing protein n=1 Tax=Paraburkholderia fynbosensis TaxID=1200993 RepID=A0A6J5H120_9BURK|nr:hypothetical protein LMG27177_07321 [Paraburkholderia fynbosensis]